MIKIGIDPSGTGTTGIVVYKNDILIEKCKDFNDKNWINHYEFIYELISKYHFADDEDGYLIDESWNVFVNIENCLYTNANSSKDRDDLLRLLGAITKEYYDDEIINWVSPKHTKSIVKNIENESKYCGNKIYWGIDSNLTYEYGKGWKYNNEKISNHLRDAIIIANYEGK